MTKYQQFLNSICLIDEKTFYEALDLFPEIDIEEVSFDSDLSNKNDLCCDFVTYLLEKNTKFAYVDSLDVSTLTMELWDIDNLEELETVKELFSHWVISNYDELKLTAQEEADSYEKRNIIDNIIDRLDLEELREIKEKYLDNE